jgi:hypothetical protein
MPLTQIEADALLQMPKLFVTVDPLELPRTQPVNYVRTLLSVDRREEFLFDFERGNRNRARLKYQTRGRKVIVLARLDMNGPAHRNPPDSPYKPGVRLLSPHFHKYVEHFDDRIAYEIMDVPGLTLRDPTNAVFCLEDFLHYCSVQAVPNIQLTV